MGRRTLLVGFPLTTAGKKEDVEERKERNKWSDNQSSLIHTQVTVVKGRKKSTPNERQMQEFTIDI